MGVVHGRVKRDRRGRAAVLITLVVEQALQLGGIHLDLVMNHVVVDGASGTLDGGVRA